jgi:tyrosyl-tRNA synthetase
LTPEQVAQNAKTYKEQIFKVLDPQKTTVCFNSEWLKKLNFREVIELSAKTTVARMLERDDFKERYKAGQSISVHEFFYPLMQAYDSVALKADVELGGTDQTFNILMGRDIQRDYGQEPQITLFMPILEGIDGIKKMSKSLENYIGVSEPADVMYEKVMKIPDNMIIKYYNLATDVHPDRIEEIEKQMEQGVNPRDIKMDLAREITGLYHSRDETLKAEEKFKTIFQQQRAPEDVQILKFSSAGDAEKTNAFIASLMSSGKFDSKSKIRKLLEQGAVKINGSRVDGPDNIPDIKTKDIVQVGKGNFFEIKVEDAAERS